MMNDNLNNSPPPGRGMAIASMVLGIVSLSVSWWLIPGVGIIVPIVGLILGIIAKRALSQAGAPSGMATAGIVMCIIAISLKILFIIACIACIGAIGGLSFTLDELMHELQMMDLNQLTYV